MIEQGFNHQSPCICNSGKKYKVCHGKKIHTLVECI
nr:SEC-C metal-binding domain-containing protein [Pseudoalteromonas sp. Z1A6]